ncbi:MAG: hypothetical protein ABSD58_11745 [Verrucomicrobiia bacterium]
MQSRNKTILTPGAGESTTPVRREMSMRENSCGRTAFVSGIVTGFPFAPHRRTE